MTDLPTIECDGSSGCAAGDHVDGCYSAALQARWCDEHGRPWMVCSCALFEPERVDRPGDRSVVDKLDEVLLRLVELASHVPPRCSCDGDPIECSHELARAQAELDGDSARSALEEARAEIGTWHAIVLDTARLLGTSVHPNGLDRGVIIQALRTRLSSGRPAAQEAGEVSP